MTAYGKLSTEFYDADKPRAEDAEVRLFARFLEAAKGPALEAMCGSGRLLIPLLKLGFVVEGVDDSQPMLESLEHRCRAVGCLPPRVYRQSICELSLPHQYGVIFIALGSFQLLPERDTGRALSALRSHLAPGGKLVLDTFLPWDAIESGDSVRTTRRKARGASGMIHLTQTMLIDREKRRYTWKNRYELYDGDKLKATEDEELVVRWYFPDELRAMLESEGFEVTVTGIPVTSPKPARYLFEAVPRAS